MRRGRSAQVEVSASDRSEEVGEGSQVGSLYNRPRSAEPIQLIDPTHHLLCLLRPLIFWWSGRRGRVPLLAELDAFRRRIASFLSLDSFFELCCSAHDGRHSRRNKLEMRRRTRELSVNGLTSCRDVVMTTYNLKGLPELAAIEYPGPIGPASLNKALKTMGGLSHLSEVLSSPLDGSRNIELSLNTKSAFSHPVPAHVSESGNVLMRVVKRRRKQPKRDEHGNIVEEGIFTMEPIGMVTKTVRFRGELDLMLSNGEQEAGSPMLCDAPRRGAPSCSHCGLPDQGQQGGPDCSAV